MAHILDRVKIASLRSGRNPDEVKLLLATKTVSAEHIKIALEAGQTLIGENRVQEIKEKYEPLKSVVHEKHFIGHLQSNKINDILKYGVTCIQSVDQLALAEKLEQKLEVAGREMDVFIQVNTSGEESKFGVRPEDAIRLVEQVSALKHIHIKGLMTIGLFSAEKEKVLPSFRMLKAIQLKIKSMELPGVSVDELSMGMSHDFEWAIEESATIVRVGTAIFGARMYPDSYYWNENKG